MSFTLYQLMVISTYIFFFYILYIQYVCMYVRVNQTERSHTLSLAGLRVVWLLVNVCEVAFVVVVVVCEVCGRDRCRVCVCA